MSSVVLQEKHLQTWLSVAVHAAQEAGRYLMARDGAATHVTAEMARDIKLQADQRAEDRIVHVLTGGLNADVLSEERGLVAGAESPGGAQWIVDPLDGTVNYHREIPFSCVSIALWIDREPILGVVFDFWRGELYAGIVGQGATLNNRPIRVSSVARREQAVLCTGFPTGSDFSSGGILEFVDQVRAFKKVRLFGSAALSLAYVASGRADAYVERDIRMWDVAAGLALVKAAGGEVRLSGWKESSKVTAYGGNARLSPLI
jgi:myo-inositol-1(or 4)-monophosphatase